MPSWLQSFNFLADKNYMGRMLSVIIVVFIIFSLSGDVKRFTETSLAQKLRGEKTENAVVKNILSGDSFRTDEGRVIRLSGINAIKGKQGRIGLWRLIRPGTKVKLYLDGYDTQGRTLARVEREDGLKVQVALAQAQLAKAYSPSGIDHPWNEEIRLAQTMPAGAHH